MYKMDIRRPTEIVKDMGVFRDSSLLLYAAMTTTVLAGRGPATLISVHLPGVPFYHDAMGTLLTLYAHIMSTYSYPFVVA
jgi:hypothetical protein